MKMSSSITAVKPRPQLVRLRFGKLPSLIATVAATVGAAVSVTQASVIVTSAWGEITGINANLLGSPVGSVADYDGDTANDYRSTRAFSESAKLSPNLTKAGYNTEFYGGMQATYFSTTSTIAWGRTQVRNVAGDPITNITGTYAGSKGTQGLVFWKEDNYQNVTNPEFATFTPGSATDQMTITLLIDGTMPTFRFLVKTNDQYYVSQTVVTATATLSNPAGENWAPFNPAADMDFDQSSASYGAITFGALQSAGYYYELDSTATATIGFRNTGFVVDATLAVVPEPSALFLAVIGLLPLGSRRRR